MAAYSYTINNQYVTEIQSLIVSGFMIIIKCNNTNLSTNPYIYGIPYNCTSPISTNIWTNIAFSTVWTNYGAQYGYFFTTISKLFKNTDFMNPVSIDSGYIPIAQGADDSTVYVYKSSDTGIYKLENGTYTRLGTAGAAPTMLDNEKKYYSSGSTIYRFPAYNQSLVAEKHYAFWFKGSSIKFGNVSISTDAYNWLYCRLTASGSTVSWRIVRAELNNGALDYYAGSAGSPVTASLATYGTYEQNSNLDLVLNGSVEEFTSDTTDIAESTVLLMVKHKYPYSNPGTSGNLPSDYDVDKFTMVAKYPERVVSNIVGGTTVVPAGPTVTLQSGAAPGTRVAFTCMGSEANPCLIKYKALDQSNVTDTIKTVVDLMYTWTGAAWLCTSAPPIGRIIEQKPDEPTPAAMYGGQWQEHNYGGVFFRSKGGDSCGFHAAYKVASWASGSSVTLAEDAKDGNGTAISANNYILVAVYGAASYYRKITAVSGRVLTLESALPSGYANLTEVIIGQYEGIPDIDFSFRTTAWDGDVRTWGSAIQESYIGGKFLASGNGYPDRIYRIHLNNSNPVYRNTSHIAPNAAILRYWRRFQ